MFYHGYDSYLEHAYPLDELKPLTCTGQDTWGSFSLTLVDALDTLLIMGNVTEFNRVVGVCDVFIGPSQRCPIKSAPSVGQSICDAKFSYFLPLDFLAFWHQTSLRV